MENTIEKTSKNNEYLLHYTEDYTLRLAFNIEYGYSYWEIWEGDKYLAEIPDSIFSGDIDMDDLITALNGEDWGMEYTIYEEQLNNLFNFIDEEI